MPSSVLVRVVFGVLVLATFGAFIVAQRLKRSTPIVDQVYYPRWIAPKCHCPRSRARFYFALKHAGRVTVTVVDSAGDEVRTLASDTFLSRRRHHYTWAGGTDQGTAAPDGRYQLRVTLLDQGRSVTLPRVITLDTVPPTPRITSIAPSLIVPGTRGALASTRITYQGASSHPPLIQIYRTDLPKAQLMTVLTGDAATHSATWDGLAGGRPVPDGVYVVTVTTYDEAGNAGSFPRRLPPTPRETGPGSGVSVRYLTLSGSLDPVMLGDRARFTIGPLPQRFQWRLGQASGGPAVAHGRARGRQLVVKLPRNASAGLYVLTVRAAGRRASQPVVVRGRSRARVLVVLPAIAWQGGNLVDDDGDGFANTLFAGNSVRAERPFAHGQLPADLMSRVEPLLAFLAGQRLSYEITSDLALAQSGGAALGGHSGVVFAGNETWLTDRLDLALRNYVENGGRVASFGTDAFRRRVSLVANALTAPTPPERVNVFGEETSQAQIADAPMVVNQPDTLGLFRGTDGLVGLFSQFEQSQQLVGGAQVLSSAGRDPHHPAFVAYRLGKGIVVRVGASAWSADLANDSELSDVTRRIWSLLSQ